MRKSKKESTKTPMYWYSFGAKSSMPKNTPLPKPFALGWQTDMHKQMFISDLES
jgi:hypothetical protein